MVNTILEVEMSTVDFYETGQKVKLAILPLGWVQSSPLSCYCHLSAAFCTEERFSLLADSGHTLSSRDSEH